MQLSRSQFTELLRRWETQPDTSEVRSAPRLLMRRNIAIEPDPAEPLAGGHEVVLQDISRGGVRISHHEGMARGRRFVLLLPGIEQQPLRVVCIVRHCRMLKQHLFQIGAEFDGVHSDAPPAIGAGPAGN